VNGMMKTLCEISSYIHENGALLYFEYASIRIQDLDLYIGIGRQDCTDTDALV
jgi:hypothetical protein